MRVVQCVTCCCRSEQDTEAWWVTGERESFFFFYLHKPGGAHKSAGPHTRVCLAKVAGDLGAMQRRGHMEVSCVSGRGYLPAGRC